MFEPEAITADLARHRAVFAHLLSGRPDALRRWRPAPGKWSLLEIVCHLHDEERDDFRARVQHALSGASGPAPEIDPEGWVAARAYAQQDYDTVLESFLRARDESVAWLRGLEAPDWSRAWQHAKLGPMTARMFLASWLAHDALHLRQIVRYEYLYLRHTSGENLSYAGEW